MMSFRTDRNNNPTAFTTDIAKQGGLVEGVDYTKGDPFKTGDQTYFTAKLLYDPFGLTIKVIDNIGFYNKAGQQRWVYIGIPYFIWKLLNTEEKIEVIKFMYSHEGGTEFLI